LTNTKQNKTKKTFEKKSEEPYRGYIENNNSAAETVVL